MSRDRSTKHEQQFWEEHPNLLLDDPEDPNNELISILRQQAQFYFDHPDRHSYECWRYDLRHPIERAKDSLYSAQQELKLAEKCFSEGRYLGAALNIQIAIRKLNCALMECLWSWRGQGF